MGMVALVQGAFGKTALFTFGLTTYVMLGLRVVCSSVPSHVYSLEPATFDLYGICSGNFTTFQLGGPLALPWGLYVLICQVPVIP